MNRQDIEKLLGGYATGTLTPAEREALFAAALEDQQLFEALAAEEPLRELLEDPIAKTRLQAVLEPAPKPGLQWWLRTAAWGIPAVGLAAVAIVFVLQRPAARQPVTIAEVRQFRQAMPAVPLPSPLPQTLEKRPLPPVPPAKHAPPLPAQSVAAVARLPEPPPVLKDAAAEPKAADLASNNINVPQPARPPIREQAGAVRLEATAAAITGVGGAAAFPEARSLYFGASPRSFFQTNLAAPRAQAAPAPLVKTQADASAVQSLGVRYTVLRRQPDGQLAAAEPGGILTAGDSIVLRFEPNGPGFLSVYEHAVDGNWHQLWSSRVDRSIPYDVPAAGALTLDGPGPRELFVVFSRQEQAAPYPVPEVRLDQVSSENRQERMTYVVSTATLPVSQTLAFPITLPHN